MGDCNLRMPSGYVSHVIDPGGCKHGLRRKGAPKRKLWEVVRAPESVEGSDKTGGGPHKRQGHVSLPAEKFTAPVVGL